MLHTITYFEQEFRMAEKYTPVVADLTFNMEIKPSVVDLRAITLPSQVNWLRL